MAAIFFRAIPTYGILPLVVVMNSMVDYNEMSTTATPPFLYNLGPVKPVN